jgi:hypothetical protein
MAVKLVLWDENWNQSQGTGIAIDSKDTWSTVSYKYGDPSDYTSADGDGNILFNIEKVTIVSVVAIVYGASGVSEETLYLDSLDW